MCFHVCVCVFACVCQPDVIVHCAAERRPDVMERHTEAAVHLNVHATGTVAKEAGQSVVVCLFVCLFRPLIGHSHFFLPFEVKCLPNRILFTKLLVSIMQQNKC